MLIYNASFDSQTRVLSLLDKAGNVISSCEVPSKEVDDITKPLTFKAKQDGSTVKLIKNGSPVGTFQTSTDGGNTWTDYTIDTVITLNIGDEVSFRAKADRTSEQNSGKYFHFMMSGKIEAWHNVMSLYRTNDFATYNTAMGYAFTDLFGNFCTSLTKAPALPATTLADSCYYRMFYGCTSLAKAPELPATALAVDCYYSMLQGCTSLVEAPELPATALADGCYSMMFFGCTSLTKAPSLPATTLADRCYNYMFNGCSNLNEVRCHMPSSYSSSQVSSKYASNWLKGVSSTGTFYTNADAKWSSGVSGIPTGWNRVPAVDDITKPLTLKATQDGSTVKLTAKGSPSGAFQTSRDGGNTWADYTIDDVITLNTGEEVSFRSKSDRTSAQDYKNHFYFMMEGKIEAWHNVMSMIRTNDFATYNTTVIYAFGYLFDGCTSMTKASVLPATTLAQSCYICMFNGCTSLTKAPELPATALADYCYANMFRGCTSLVNAPVLPATTLTKSCYDCMFSGCTSLVNAPELPVTTLAERCCYSMFSGCTSLTKAPALPATKLASNCYASMFSGCTSLTEAPALSATTLAQYCYQYMFMGCTSLTKAPALPATTLESSCYSYMFRGCTSLTEAPALPATTLADYCYQHMFESCRNLNEVRCHMPSSYSSSDIASSYAKNWLEGVSATGTFYTNADANWSSGESGIPTGWNRVAVDDITKPLTFKATQDGSTIKLRKNGSPTGDLQTSRDGGNTWVDYTIDTAITLNTGDEVSFRAKADRTSAQSDNNYFRFYMTGKIEAWHNVMSLYRTNNFSTYNTVVDSAFLLLFYNCTSLTKAPTLPATTLASSCYYRMFDGCTSLTKAPALPATKLASSCYSSMFFSCTSLVEAPALPATTLVRGCCSYMFYGCTSLTKAPELPATTLAESCYDNMFSGCSKLKEVRIAATTTNYNALNGWLSGVSTTGDFYCDPNATIFPTDSGSGIPSGWTRHALADYPANP